MLLPVNVRLVRAFALVSAASFVTSTAVLAAPPAPRKPMAQPVIKAAPAPLPKLPANVYARVGGQDITTKDIVAFLSELGGYPLVRQKVQVLIAEREAKRLGVTVTDAELNKTVADQKKAIVTNSAMQGTPMSFEDFGAKEGISSGLLREQTRFQLLLRKTYAQSVGSLAGKVKVTHILIATAPLPTNPNEPPKPQTPAEAAKQDAEALVKVKKLKADLTAGTIKFNDAVTQFSDDPSKVQNHGDMGWLAKDSQFVPEFVTGALALKKVGEVSEPIKTQFGYHLIRLDSIGDKATPQERIAYRKQIEASADSQAIQGWFTELTQKTLVVYNPLAKAVSSAPAAKKVALTSKGKG